MEKVEGLDAAVIVLKNDSCPHILFADTVMLGYGSQTCKNRLTTMCSLCEE